MDAMRSGEVDAIMVSGTKGDQVYAISSADTPYRTFIEEMSEGAVTLARDGTILYCNHRFADFAQVSYDKTIGSNIYHHLTARDAKKLEALLDERTAKESGRIIVSLKTLAVAFSISHLPSYLEGDYYILIATDISDLKRREQELVNLVARLERHLEAMRALRIDTISEHLDNKGVKNKLKAANSKLVKEMTALNRTIEKLKQRKPGI